MVFWWVIAELYGMRTRSVLAGYVFSYLQRVTCGREAELHSW
jgi:hypothetical protein